METEPQGGPPLTTVSAPHSLRKLIEWKLKETFEEECIPVLQ